MNADAAAAELRETGLRSYPGRIRDSIKSGNLGSWPVLIALAIIVVVFAETATRIAVLRLGRNVGVYERAKSTQEEIVHAITAGAPTKVAGIPGTSTATQVTA